MPARMSGEKRCLSDLGLKVGDAVTNVGLVQLVNSCKARPDLIGQINTLISQGFFDSQPAVSKSKNDRFSHSVVKMLHIPQCYLSKNFVRVRRFTRPAHLETGTCQGQEQSASNFVCMHLHPARAQVAHERHDAVFCLHARTSDCLRESHQGPEVDRKTRNYLAGVGVLHPRERR